MERRHPEPGRERLRGEGSSNNCGCHLALYCRGSHGSTCNQSLARFPSASPVTLSTGFPYGMSAASIIHGPLPQGPSLGDLQASVAAGRSMESGTRQAKTPLFAAEPKTVWLGLADESIA